MLRESIQQTGEKFDMEALAGVQAVDSDIPNKELLLALAEAVTLRQWPDGLRSECQAALGDAGFADACATAAAFQGFNRVADANGIEIEEWQHGELEDIRGGIGIDGFFRAAE